MGGDVAGGSETGRAEMKEVRIAGGGPAGLALGILLRRQGVPVRLFEAGSYPRHKICGEFFAPREFCLPSRLGLEEALQGALPVRTAAWFGHSRAHRPARFRLPHPAAAIPRFLLDESLRAYFEESGGRVETGARVEPGGKEGWVTATGRVRAPGRCRWMGYKAHFENLPLAAGLEMHFGRRAYVGLCEVAPGVVNVSGLFRAEKLPGAGRWTPLLKAHGLHRLAQRIEHATMRQGTACGVSHVSFGWQPGGAAPKVGDALAVIPPMAGNGLSIAWETAALAAAPLAAWARGAWEWAAACATIEAAARKRLRRRLRWAQIAQALWLEAAIQPVLHALSRTKAFPWQRGFFLLGA